MGVKQLVEQFRKDYSGADKLLRESFAKKQIKPKDFDLGQLFAECFGYETYRECAARRKLANDVFHETTLREGTGAVTTASFQNISGQIVYSAILEAYQAEDFVFSKLIPETPTQFLDGEKIAGVTEIGDEAAVRKETDPYTLAGVSEDWIFTPPVLDRGMIVPVSWEAVFADRTGLLLERCSAVGKWMGVNKEKRAIDCVVDENTTAHRYNWRGTVIASYGDNSGTHTWDNLAASNALLDWTDVDAAEQVFNGLVDPYTGEPIMIEAKHLVHCLELIQTARRILSATEIRVATPGYATTGNPTQTNMPNPYSGKYQSVTSRLLAQRMATDTSWFLGDVSKYAKYMVAEPMTTVQAPSNNKDEFERRIVQQYRVNERGAFVVVQPRAIVKSTA